MITLVKLWWCVENIHLQFPVPWQFASSNLIWCEEEERWSYLCLQLGLVWYFACLPQGCPSGPNVCLVLSSPSYRGNMETRWNLSVVQEEIWPSLSLHKWSSCAHDTLIGPRPFSYHHSLPANALSDRQVLHHKHWLNVKKKHSLDWVLNYLKRVYIQLDYSKVHPVLWEALGCHGSTQTVCLLKRRSEKAAHAFWNMIL